MNSCCQSGTLARTMLDFLFNCFVGIRASFEASDGHEMSVGHNKADHFTFSADAMGLDNILNLGSYCLSLFAFAPLRWSVSPAACPSHRTKRGTVS